MTKYDELLIDAYIAFSIALKEPTDENRKRAKELEGELRKFEEDDLAA